MAIRSKNAPSAVETRSPIVATIGEFKGTETLAVGPENGRPDWNLSAGPAKWSRLFAIDPDGDCIMSSVFGFISSHTDDMAALTAGVDAFIADYKAWKAEYFDEEEIEQEEVVHTVSELTSADPVAWKAALDEAYGPDYVAPVVEEEVAPVEDRPALTKAQKDMVLKRLRAETKVYRLATPAEKTWLENDVLMMVWDGMTFDDYRTYLRAFPTVGDYMAHVS